MTSFTLTYTFGIPEDLDDFDCSITRLPSAKCLYLWRCGDWHGKDPRKPAVGHSADHIVILADTPCVETGMATVVGENLAREAATVPDCQPITGNCFSHLASSKIKPGRYMEVRAGCEASSKNGGTTDGGIDRGHESPRL